MPELKTTKAFTRTLNKLTLKNQRLYELIKERLKSLSESPSAFHLENHKLRGQLKDYYAITITRDYRLVFYIDKAGAFVLFDIGSHDDVY